MLLGIILFFFSLDRQIISILKTTLMTDLGVTNQNYSILVMAFMIPYTFCYLFSGGIVDRFGSRYLLTVLLIAMSAATLISGLATSLNWLIAGRVLLGVAESGIVPALTLAVFHWFPAERRAFAFQTTNLIQSLGFISGPPFVAWVTLSAGWRWAFFIPAMAGIIVAVLWFIAAGRAPKVSSNDENAPQQEASAVPVYQRYKMVLTSKPIWVLMIARLITDPFWFFYQYWQTGFMQERLGLSLADVGKLMWFPPLASVFGVLGACYISDRLVARGCEPTRARLILIWSVTVLSVFTFMLPSVTNPIVAVAIMSGINFMCATWLSMATITMGGLAPSVAIATAIGIMSALGGVTSIIFNGFVGTIIDRFGYSVPIYVGGAFHPAAALLLAIYFLRYQQNNTSAVSR
ncbi:MFS transporter [Telmatospirillum sp.]|uniref:MFS transporter n=1 Tax=Telmatospirillum sp. TaxID=2079197 RepID=UPI00283E1F3C|nr:MFS transporter [Telmatospirillum sp.]MDR3439141.1 MFS transporter [Telmatospirillum sp.]